MWNGYEEPLAEQSVIKLVLKGAGKCGANTKAVQCLLSYFFFCKCMPTHSLVDMLHDVCISFIIADIYVAATI